MAALWMCAMPVCRATFMLTRHFSGLGDLLVTLQTANYQAVLRYV